jgi:hypothetical protein
MSEITLHLAKIEAYCTSKGRSGAFSPASKYSQSIFSPIAISPEFASLSGAASIARGIINDTALLSMVFVGSIVIGSPGVAAQRALHKLNSDIGVIHTKSEQSMAGRHTASPLPGQRV